MIINLNVTYLDMEDWICSHMKCKDIVTEHTNRRSQLNTKLAKKVLKPSNFCDGGSMGTIFCINTGSSDGRLFLGCPCEKIGKGICKHLQLSVSYQRILPNWCQRKTEKCYWQIVDWEAMFNGTIDVAIIHLMA